MGGTVDPNFVSDTFEIDYVRVYQQDYGINDDIDPTEVGNIQAVKILDSTAYLLWTRATDNQQVKYYHIYLNNKHYKSTSLNILKLKNLTPETDYLVEIEAEDYAGNRSPKKTIAFKTNASS